ncbi:MULTISPECIES: hypothetical protein [unclassified Mesorhizobium]|nr:MULTISPECIES: hypothetical protein [unclassified Mesorhizobium]RWA93631.1 MAG: hypothetical protein EOQ31_00595 [Mesorhizobium sp.]RWX63051.1 hypothetical protein EOA24_26325 [Mesorhizobium sp. M2A.F.Ca.ET.039.01.1.1]TIV18848.1 MAG: hypothetical protein E5V95_11675 [Mesorhizobium sp.]
MAEKASREASANLRSLTERRESLKVERTVENPGKNRIPDATYRAMHADLEAQLTAAQVTEREALAEWNSRKAAYHDHVRATLAADIDGLGALICNHLDQVMELLDIAAALGTGAREYRVEMPGLVSGAPAAKQLLQAAIDSTITKMISKGRRP